jgi:hypothetical protein
MSMQRVWVVLQRNDNDFPDSVDVVGVYSSPTRAEEVLAKCKALYEQFYYIQDVLLDGDFVGK